MIRTHDQTADNCMALSTVTVLPELDGPPRNCPQKPPSLNFIDLPNHSPKEALGLRAARPITVDKDLVTC
ncbi:hypothetical protein D3C80_2152560 [compost metagenome]